MMKYRRFIHLFLVLTAIMAISLMIFSGCMSTVKETFFIPEFKEPRQPPIEVSVAQLWADYMVDKAAADAKYRGARIFFPHVEVEEVITASEQLSDGSLATLKVYFTIGPVKFSLRELGIMQYIEPGYVLNIVGECEGMRSGLISGTPYVYIYNCWVESIEGYIGTPESVDIY